MKPSSEFRNGYLNHADVRVFQFIYEITKKWLGKKLRFLKKLAAKLPTHARARNDEHLYYMQPPSSLWKRIGSFT